MNFEFVEKRVVKWGEDRALFTSSSTTDQCAKLAEELEELTIACRNKDHAGIVDGIGDMLVVLTMISHMVGEDLFTCFAAAYLEIKDRKGKMVNGLFVKEQ